MARAFIARMRWAAHKWREFDSHAAAAFSLRLVEGIAELERVVIIDEAVGHPDLARDRAMLAKVQARLTDALEQ